MAVMTPVSPIPPAVAQNRSGSSVGGDHESVPVVGVVSSTDVHVLGPGTDAVVVLAVDVGGQCATGR